MYEDCKSWKVYKVFILGLEIAKLAMEKVDKMLLNVLNAKEEVQLKSLSN